MVAVALSLVVVEGLLVAVGTYCGIPPVCGRESSRAEEVGIAAEGATENCDVRDRGVGGVLGAAGGASVGVDVFHLGRSASDLGGLWLMTWYRKMG